MHGVLVRALIGGEARALVMELVLIGAPELLDHSGRQAGPAVVAYVHMWKIYLSGER